jgi:pimeloyl-ACP methyl ester carboxylesterase
MPGGQMSALHFGPMDAPVRCVFVHANGFNAQTYRCLLEPLGVHIVALDMRGHGFTKLPMDISALKSFDIFANDIATFISRYVPGQVLLAGHSFSAVAGILAAFQLKDRLTAYVGFDPVSLPWLPRQFPKLPGGRRFMKTFFPLAKNAGRRRHEFDSRDSVFERYKGRGAFRGVQEQILQDYLDGGLLEAKTGVKLACNPLWEQAIYTAQGHNIFKAAHYLPDDSRIIYGGKAAVSTPGTRQKIERILGEGSVEYRPDFHHLFPFQETEFCQSELRRAMQL